MSIEFAIIFSVLSLGSIILWLINKKGRKVDQRKKQINTIHRRRQTD